MLSSHRQVSLTSKFFNKTYMAPTTAFNGRNKSDDSLMVSTAILTAAYAVCQFVSLPRTVAPSLDVSRIPWGGDPMGGVMAVDKAAGLVEVP